MVLPSRLVELYIDGAWTDITADWRSAAGIDIKVGRGDWTSRIAPARCVLTLDNRTGKYSNRNPASPYYGKIGRNTPLRVSLPTVEDTFTRTSVSTWGSTESGVPWGLTGGTSNNYNVNGGVGKLSPDTIGVKRFARYLPTPRGIAEVDATVTVSTAVTATGSDFKAAIVGRYLSTAHHYVCYLQFGAAPSNNVYLDVSKVVGGVESIIAVDTTTGLTPHVAGTAYKVRFKITGSQLKAKCWLASAAEPAAWNIEATDTAHTLPGMVGVAAVVQPGNTNALPVVFSFDDWTVHDVRFTGEVASWPPRWNYPGTDVHTEIEAAGVLRRLGQGRKPLRSELYRGISPQSTVAYWPLEDASGAASFAEATGTRGPMRFGGSVSPAGAEYPGLGGSAPLAELGTGATLAGHVIAHTSTSWSVSAIMWLPSEVSADTVILKWLTKGDPNQWRLKLGAGTPDSIALQGHDADGTLIVDHAVQFIDSTDNSQVYGRWLLLTASCAQNGGNMDYSVEWLFGDGLGGDGLGGSSAGTVGAVTWVGLDAAPAVLDGMAIGHIVVRAPGLALFGNTDNQFMGVQPEPAESRIDRLCEAEGVPYRIGTFAVVPATADTGTQPVDELLDVLHAAADTDMGILSESREVLGLTYRAHSDLYNQDPTIALDYDAGHLGGELAPVDDDQLLRNDVTVSRMGGSSRRAARDTGPLSTAPPPAGAGIYDESVTVNAFSDDQLDDIAGWRVHLGTWDEARYEQVTVNTSAPAVAAAPALRGSIGRAQLGDVISIENLPAWLPPDTAELMIQGYREWIGPVTRELTWNCTPYGPWRVFVLDESRLEVTGCTLAEDLTTTETDITVNIAAGHPLWTTDPAEFPLDVELGGERVTVTAISGAASPQTMTATRSANGVVKTHSTGAEVKLWRAAVLALQGS